MISKFRLAEAMLLRLDCMRKVSLFARGTIAFIRLIGILGLLFMFRVIGSDILPD